MFKYSFFSPVSEGSEPKVSGPQGKGATMYHIITFLGGVLLILAYFILIAIT